ncbi:MAG: ABC transporter permease [Clostridiales bacterium]|jgi:ABC-type dipeptide/oligopeptide/nickel transport system permease subunit|nr:ABC transporter permease [Clostridiales bacterium]
MDRNKKQLIIAVCILSLTLLFGISAKFFSPHDPYKTDLSIALLSPCAEYPFGTDNLGRCILSRVLEGAATSIFSAVFVVLCVSVIGTAVGICAGFFGGTVDKVLMRLTMIVQAFPSYVLAVAIAGMLGTGMKNAVIALVVMYWTIYARLSRSLVMQIRNENYIKVAKLCGAGNGDILLKYILPNVLSPLIVTAALDIAGMMLSMAGLSFLGLGAQPPLVEWGILISNSRNFLQVAPWCLVFPSLFLFLVVVLFNFAGDRLRDYMALKGEN